MTIMNCASRRFRGTRQRDCASDWRIRFLPSQLACRMPLPAETGQSNPQARSTVGVIRRFEAGGEVPNTQTHAPRGGLSR
jgi:hypothetical protein